MKITLNIGLHVGNKIWTKERALEQVKLFMFPEKYQVKTGTYNGVKEQTLVVSSTISGREDIKLIENIRALCVTLQQDCIALKFMKDMNGTSGNLNGVLVYHPRYKGDRMEFDNSLFLNI